MQAAVLPFVWPTRGGISPMELWTREKLWYGVPPRWHSDEMNPNQTSGPAESLSCVNDWDLDGWMSHNGGYYDWKDYGETLGSLVETLPPAWMVSANGWSSVFLPVKEKKKNTQYTLYYIVSCLSGRYAHFKFLWKLQYCPLINCTTSHFDGLLIHKY